MQVEITETKPDGTVHKYMSEAPTCSRDEIDIPGSLVAQRFMNQGMPYIDAMNAGAKWSEDNDALINDALANGLEGEAIVAFVTRANLKQTRSAAVPPEVEPDPVIDSAAIEADLPEFRVSIRGAFERARVLAFWLRNQVKDALDDLDDRDMVALAAIIGADCKLREPFEFSLNHPQEKLPDAETETADPSDPPGAR